MEKTKADKNKLREFALVMAAGFLAVSAIVLFRQRTNPFTCVLLAAGFAFLGIFLPLALKPFYMAWMKLAFILSWINTRLILVIIFYLLFTPLGILMRLFGKDLLEKRIDRNKDSYWRKREVKAFQQTDYEHQF